MPAKKKVEEELPPPEEFLPPGFSLGCEVYWVDDDLPAAENGEQVTQGVKGSLTLVHELAQPGNRIEFVDVQFEGLSEAQKVPFGGVSLQPPKLEAMRVLSTGLVLSLRGLEVEKVLEAGSQAGGVATSAGYGALADAVEALLQLEAAYPEPPQRDIVRDYHVFAIEHGRSLCLSFGQIAVFHSIMARLLDRIRECVLEQRPLTASECFQDFQKLVIAHATNDPPKRLPIFSGAEARLLVDFASGTIFKHFLLYQCCLGCPERVEVQTFVNQVERPRPPPALSLVFLKETKRPDGAETEGGSSATDAAATEGAAAQEAEAEELSEEEEIERQVAAKLRETEALLKKRLDEREELFKQKLAEAPPPGKKK